MLENAFVVDPAAGALLPGLHTVVVQKGKVTHVYPADEPDLLVDESKLERINLAGRYISP